MIFLFITIKLRDFVKPAVIFVLIAALIYVSTLAIPSKSAVDALGTLKTGTLVIDAGHGGIDGGAVSATGDKESDINLSIALKMSSLCELLGINYVLTRESDVPSSPEGYSEHDNLIARAEVANSIENAVLISIHQNKFPSDKVRGAEVMYANSAQSRALGLAAQSNLVSAVDPENRRVARPAPAELLLTASVRCPAILAECGFMSNTEESRLLSTDTYQMKIAVALVSAYIIYSTEQSAI